MIGARYFAPTTLERMTLNQKDQSSRMSSRTFQLWLAFGTFISVLVMGALLVFELQQRQDMRTAARMRSDSITAITFHFEREFLRLQRSLDLAVNGSKPVDLDELNLRYDLTLSRVGILRDSTNIEALINMPQYALALPKVERVLDKLGKALEKNPPLRDELAVPLKEFDEIGVELHDLTLAANSEMSRQLMRKEEDELRQNNLILSLSSAMLVFLLATGVALIRRHRGQELARREQFRLMDSLRELNEHLEAKVQERTREIQASMEAAQTSALHAEHARALVQATLEATDNAIVVLNADGEITLTNRHFSETFQQEMEANQASDDMTLPAPLMASTESSSVLLGRAIPFGTERVFRDTFTREDGRIFARVSHPQHVNGKLVGRVWSFLEITEQVQAENRVLMLSEALSGELAHSLQRNGLLNALLGAIPDMVWMKDMEGRFISCNAAFERLIGTSTDKVIGKTEYDFNPPEVADNFLEADREALNSNGAIVKEHWQPLGEGGSKVLIEVTKVAVRDSKGDLVGVLGIARDVTELRQLMNELRAAKEEALQASEAKSMFLANMSHEIRTPMNAVIGMANLALDTQLNLRQHNYISKIKSASESLLHIINDILDFSKIEAGKLHIEATPFDLEDTLDVLSGLMALRAERQGIELTYAIANRIPAVLIGDSLRLEQVLTNLVSNALKFSAGGNVVLAADVLRMDAQQVELQFSVSDQGIGLSEEQVSQMFRPFTQADASTTRRYGGTGLGLAICKNLVELLGGRIWVDSKVGVGSTFHFTVTFQCGADRRQSETAELARALQAQAHKTIMVVEDNEVARRTLEGMLAPLGLPVQYFADGPSIVAAMRAAERPEALLFLVDWFMPELDGIATIRQLRSHYAQMGQDAPPMLLVTAHLFDDDLQKVDDVIDGLIAKPLSARRLMAEIAGALNLQVLTPLKQGARKTDGLDWAPLQQLDILLVEDVEVNREVMMELLGSVGLTVRQATNGAEALDAIAHKTPDMVLMDCQMPVMDGYTATRKLRAMPAYASLPVVALTAGAMVEDKRKCFAAGMNGYVTKPVRLESLYEQLILCMPDRAPANAKTSPAAPQAPTSLAPQLPVLPGIDVPLGLAQVGGRLPMLLRVLKKFRDNHGASFESNFSQAVQSQDWSAAHRYAHSLKGVSRTLGASDLADSAHILEAAVEHHDANALSAQLALVMVHLQTVMEGLAGLEALMAPPAAADGAA